MWGRLALLALLLTGCGKPPDFGEFKPYVIELQNEAAARGLTLEVRGLEIRMGHRGQEIPLDRAGICVRSEFPRRIYIAKDEWDAFSPTQRETLILHELGHCVLDREHDNEMLSDRPKSVMNWQNVPPDSYQAHRTEYLDELFRLVQTQ